jgi:prepilin-type N-terminal cleavage/methylation domain-containing protein
MARMRSGMTLVELLVVLVIIGILGAVSLRAIDVTRERTNYDKTMKSMQRLANAIAGNPDLIAEGRRSDFGFVGDVGRLPTGLEELRRNVSNNPAWNGPYVRIPFTGDSTSFKIDAWGQEFQYLPDRGTILSLANGRFPLTYQVTPDTDFLFRNPVSGTVTDNEGNPPGDQAPTVQVHLWLTNPTTGQPMHYDTTVGQDGSYRFAAPDRGVAVGNHLITAVWGTDSLSKWVGVEPRVGAVVDLRFGNTRMGVLKLITGSVAVMPGPTSPVNNVTFEVINTGSSVVKLDTISFYRSDSTAFCETLLFNGDRKWNWVSPMPRRASNNDPMWFPAEDSVLGMARVRVNLRAFNTEPLNPGTPKDMHGDSLKLKFSDGSYIGFVIP